jgi:hypothetical protein
MTMQNTTPTTQGHAGDRLSWPDCAYCDTPMMLRSIKYTARGQLVTFECPVCRKQAAGCSVDS